MKTLLRLTKFNLNYYLKPRFADKKDKKKFIMLCAFLCLCFLMPLAMAIAVVYNGTGIAVKLGVLPEFMSVLFFSAEIAVIVLGITTYLNIMYFSKDNSILASMPIKSNDIYISKLIVCLISMSLLSTVMTIPSIIAIGVGMHNAGVTVGVSFYLVGLMGIICIPLLPVLVVSILSFPIMKIVSFLRRRPVLMGVVSTVMAIGVICVIWGFMFSFGGIFNQENMSDAIVDTFTSVGRFSYVTLILAKAMVGVDVGANVGITLAITIGCFAVGIALSTILYKNTIQKLGEGGGYKKVNADKIETKKQSDYKALFKRETMSVMRSPDLFMQTLMMIILGPVLIVFISFMDKGNNAKINDGGLFIIGMVYFYINVMMGMNYLSMIGISREREKVSLLKTLPVDPKKIIRVKMAFADAASLVGVAISSIVFGVCNMNLAWYHYILMPIMTLITSMSINCYGLYRDVKKPNLKWINVKEITKNNFGALIPMLFSIVPGILVMVVAGIVAVSQLPQGIKDAIVWGIVAIFSFVLYFVLRFRKVDEIANMFSNIEC